MYPDSQFHSHFRKNLPECFSVMVLSNLVPQNIHVFRMNPRQYSAFVEGELSLVPYGCCNPSGGACIHRCEVLWKGEFKSSKQIVDLLTTFEQTLLQESRGTCK
jgi:hypothetical protein